MRYHLLIGIIFLTANLFAQTSRVFYQTYDGKYAFTFERQKCLLYELPKYRGVISREWELEPTKKKRGRLDSVGILFSNESYAISYDLKYFRVCKLKKGKVKYRHTYVVRKMADPSIIYEIINRRYWNDVYRNTVDAISREYPLFREYYYYSYGYINWYSPTLNKKAYPEEFEVLANHHCKQLKGLETTNIKLSALNDSIQKHIDTLTLEELKKNYLSRPLGNYAYNEYHSEMLESVAVNRPELFFDLAKALPTEKKTIFYSTSYSRNVKKSLKSVSDSPIKKEYFKYKRKEKLKLGLIASGVIALETAVIGGVITGVYYLIAH